MNDSIRPSSSAAQPNAEHGGLQGAVPLLVKPVEAARLLAISPRKLWELSMRGVVPTIRMGRSVRYSIDELQRFVTTRR